MSAVRAEFVGVDFWSRALFRDKNGNYYANLDMLFDGTESAQRIIDDLQGHSIEYF
jgi:hypothetical protein